MGPDFRLYALFLISDKKQRVYYIPSIKLVYFENQKFLPPVYSIARFYKKGYRVKTNDRRKKAASYSASG